MDRLQTAFIATLIVFLKQRDRPFVVPTESIQCVG
jgi:hypothetical protein